VERPIRTAEEFERPSPFCERTAEVRAPQPESTGPFSTAEEMIREDRDR
jgi:hypothetical protein